MAGAPPKLHGERVTAWLPAGAAARIGSTPPSKVIAVAWPEAVPSVATIITASSFLEILECGRGHAVHNLLEVGLAGAGTTGAWSALRMLGGAAARHLQLVPERPLDPSQRDRQLRPRFSDERQCVGRLLAANGAIGIGL